MKNLNLSSNFKFYLFLSFFLTLLACQNENVVPAISSTQQHSNAQSDLPFKFTIVSPKDQNAASTTVEIKVQNRTGEAISMDYMITVVPLQLGYYLDLGRGTMHLPKGGKSHTISLTSPIPLTQKDGFYFYEMKDGWPVNGGHYYKVNAD